MSEQARIEQEYQRRAQDPLNVERYSALNMGNLHAIQSRERALVGLLRRQQKADLARLQLLDVGCGSGGELLNWLSFGCEPANCHGVDLLESRIATARRRLPGAVTLQAGDAGKLAYPDATFDIVTQFTVFSSILDPALQQRIAREMLRVLKPDGIVIWYDFWLNPTNRATRGLRLGAVKRLFPGCRFDARRITLAPPIARRVAPRSWLAADLLEKLPLRTHWLVGIQKQS